MMNNMCVKCTVPCNFTYLSAFGYGGPSLLLGLFSIWRTAAPLELQCLGFSSQWLLLLQSTGLRASVVVVQGLIIYSSQALEHRLSSCGM